MDRRGCRWGSAIELHRPRPGNALSIERDQALLGCTLIDLGQTTDARVQLSIAATLCVTQRLPPQALLWTGKPPGNPTLARTLLDSAGVRAAA